MQMRLSNDEQFIMLIQLKVSTGFLGFNLKPKTSWPAARMYSRPLAGVIY